jgi:hypothetical protein
MANREEASHQGRDAAADALPAASFPYEDTLTGVPDGASVLQRLLTRLTNAGLHAGSPPLLQRATPETRSK